MTVTTRQYPLPLPHREAMGADDFMVTGSNQEALSWLDKWPDWSSHCSVIVGPSGSGKTHLAHVWQNRSKARAITIYDMTAYASAALTKNNQTLLLDDADKVAGKGEYEEALFHLYNHVREIQGSLLLTAQRAPAQWQINLPDLRSRLLSVPVVTIAAPDDDLLVSLLLKQFRDRQIDVSLDVVTYLLPRMPRSPAAIRTLVTELDRVSLAEGRGISTALVRRLIENKTEDQSFPISS